MEDQSDACPIVPITPDSEPSLEERVTVLESIVGELLERIKILEDAPVKVKGEPKVSSDSITDYVRKAIGEDLTKRVQSRRSTLPTQPTEL